MSRRSFGDFDVVTGPPAVSRPLPPAAAPAASAPTALSTPVPEPAKPVRAGTPAEPPA
jgi:hypothetical protein